MKLLDTSVKAHYDFIRNDKGDPLVIVVGIVYKGFGSTIIKAFPIINDNGTMYVIPETILSKPYSIDPSHISSGTTKRIISILNNTIVTKDSSIDIVNINGEYGIEMYRDYYNITNIKFKRSSESGTIVRVVKHISCHVDDRRFIVIRDYKTNIKLYELIGSECWKIDKSLLKNI